MLRPQAEQCVHGGLPVLAWGTRDAEDDVYIHVGKPGLPRRGRRRLGVCSAVPATEGFEVSVVERLHAEAQTVATTGAQGGEFFGISRGRIRFKGNFGVRGNPERHCSRIEYPLHLGWCEEAGRAATEKDGLQRSLVGQ